MLMQGLPLRYPSKNDYEFSNSSHQIFFFIFHEISRFIDVAQCNYGELYCILFAVPQLLVLSQFYLIYIHYIIQVIILL